MSGVLPTGTTTGLWFMGTGRRALVQGKCSATGAGGTGTWLGAAPWGPEREHALLSAVACARSVWEVAWLRRRGSCGLSSSYPRTKQGAMRGQPFTNRAPSGQAGIPVNL